MSTDTEIFELTLEQALPALRRAAGTDDLRDVAVVRAEPLREEQNGYCSRGLVATVRGRADGRPWERTLFVKRLHWSHYHEAFQYERLADLGFPIVEFYGCVRGEAPVEILFVEHLERPALDAHDADEVAALFRLHARLNAMGVPAAYREDVVPVDAQQLIVDWTEAVDSLRSHAAAGDLGPALADACRTHSRDDMLAHVEATATAVAAMPLALNHGEAGPNNCGWRGDELVLFDLHKIAPAPRFRDVTGLLGTVLEGASSEPGPYALFGLTWDRAVSTYVDAYNGTAAEPVTRDRFLRDTEALRRHNAYNVLPWATKNAMESTEDVRTSADDRRRSLLRTVAILSS